MFSAHYDGFGVIRHAIYNGAADNAIGVGEMLAVAEAFARAKVKPRRSLVFIAFTAEEYGLTGSKDYVSFDEFERTKYHQPSTEARFYRALDDTRQLPTARDRDGLSHRSHTGMEARTVFVHGRVDVRELPGAVLRVRATAPVDGRDWHAKRQGPRRD